MLDRAAFKKQIGTFSLQKNQELSAEIFEKKYQMNSL